MLSNYNVAITGRLLTAKHLADNMLSFNLVNHSGRF